MAETKTSAVREILEDPASRRLDYLNARTLAYGIPGEISELRKIVEVARETYKTSRANDVRTLAALQAGVGLWIMNDYPGAAEALEPVSDHVEGGFFLGLCRTETGDCDGALKALKTAEKKGQDAFACGMAQAAALRKAGRIADALDKIREFRKTHDHEAELHYQKGRCFEARMEYEKCLDAFERAVELNPQHAAALFHMAYWYDLRGNDEAAIERYEKAAAVKPCHRNTLLNLGVLYEDRGEYEKAAAVYERVYNAMPTDQLAKMYRKDAAESLTMHYDEALEKRQSRTVQLFKTPLNEFEISARTRSCLEQMDIRTLGDLARLHEEDLAISKNLGDTALAELRELLRSRGLHFGMDEEVGEATRTRSSLALGADSEALSQAVADMDFSIRCQKCLQALNVRIAAELIERTEKDLLRCPNFGQTSLQEIKNKLASLGLSLKPAD